MVTYASGSIHFSGLGADFDSDTLINSLYEIETTYANQLIEWRSDWTARRDAFSQVRESLVNLQSTFKTLSTPDQFLVKSITSSDSYTAGAAVDSEATTGSHTLDVNQIATSSVWSISTGLEKTDIINNTADAGAFTYTYKGETRTVTVPKGTTLEGLRNLINNDGENLGVKVQLIQGNDGVVFQFSGLDTGADATLSIDSTTNLTGMGLDFEATWGTWNDGILNAATAHNAMDALVNTTATAKTFTFNVNDGDEYSVKLAAGGTLEDLRDNINAAYRAGGATFDIAAIATDGNGNYYLYMSTGNASDTIIIGEGTLEGYSGMARSTTWDVQKGQNAEIRINGWPSSGWLEKSSNTVDDVVDGVTFSLRSEGKTTVSVELDTSAILENVQSFVDAVNEFRTLLNDLTKVDESKSVLDPEYAESQSEMQMGSVLTGNYGIQLLSSRLKQAIAGQALGFNYLSTGSTGKNTGDLFSSLSQIGISTDADTSSDTFGMLVINHTTTNSSGNTVSSVSDSMLTIEQALAKDPQAVADLFAAVGKGVSNSSAFSFVSSVQSITQPGTYDVSYDIDSAGNVTNAYINGKEAKYDKALGQLGLARENPSSSDSSAVTATTDGTADFTAEVEVIQVAQKASATIATTLTDPNEAFVESGGTFSYVYNGQTHTVTVDPNEYCTLGHIAGKINYGVNNPGVSASVFKQEDGTYALKIEAKESGYGKREDGQANAFDESQLDLDFTCSSLTGVTAQEGQNAQYSIDGGPVQTSSSNTVKSSSYPGATFTLKGETAPGSPAVIKGQKHNNADGVYIRIDNWAEGTHTGTVSIKQGKVNQILDMLGGTDGILGSEGTLAILEENYDKVIENINSKLTKEEERLAKWERTMRARFARLEATLSTYNNLQSQIESQIEQLNSSSS